MKQQKPETRSHCTGHGNGSCAGPLREILHPWFCACSWCLQGIR